MAVFRSRSTLLVVRDVVMMFVIVGKRMSSCFNKEAWWGWGRVHKTCRVHC